MRFPRVLLCSHGAVKFVRVRLALRFLLTITFCTELWYASCANVSIGELLELAYARLTSTGLLGELVVQLGLNSIEPLLSHAVMHAA